MEYNLIYIYIYKERIYDQFNGKIFSNIRARLYKITLNSNICFSFKT